MKTKSITALFLTLLILFTSSITFADPNNRDHWNNQTDHNKWVEMIIFGNPAFSASLFHGLKPQVHALEDAILLCIDQYNSHYSDKLQSLKDMGINGLPKDISVIDFAAGPDHRDYTHLGWEYSYSTTKGNPTVRKDILRNTVEFIFHFKKNCSSLEQAEKKCGAMCSLLYVSHVLADRFHSDRYYGARSTILLSDDSNAETIISDILTIMPVLFPNQKTDEQYLAVINELGILSREIIIARRQNPKVEDYLPIDSDYAKKIRDLLMQNIPDLLTQQEWFANAFTMNGINWLVPHF